MLVQVSVDPRPGSRHAELVCQKECFGERVFGMVGPGLWTCALSSEGPRPFEDSFLRKIRND